MERIPAPTMADIIKDFLEPLNLTAQDIIDNTNIDAERLHRVLEDTERVDNAMALCLQHYFGPSAEFWLGIQEDCELMNQDRYDILNAGKRLLSDAVPHP